MFPKSNPQWLIIGAFALVYLVWGSTYLSVALALGSIPPFLLMGSRSVLGGIVLVAGARASGSPAATMGEWLRASVCGILFFVGCHGVLAYAQQHVPSGIAALLLATIPFWVALCEPLLPGGKRSNLRQFLLLIPGFGGVGLIVIGQMGSGASDIGDLVLLVAAAASWALGTVLSRRWSPAGIAIEYSGMELIVGGIVLLAISVLRHETNSFDLHAVTAKAFGGWLYLTVVGTIVTFAAYIWLLKRVPAKFVATYAFVNPVVAVFLAWAVLGEKLTGSILLGAALVVASVAGVLLTGGLRNVSSRECDRARDKAMGIAR
jgi:drug/metabolite transporter (DMT)-like permease